MHVGAGFSTKLSSAGLVYKHYGQDIIAKILGVEPSDAQAMRLTCKLMLYAGLAAVHVEQARAPAVLLQVKAVYLAVYKHFIEAIDAIDNGVSTAFSRGFLCFPVCLQQAA